MAQVQANGITIEYEQHGSGEPLLLIMGLGGQLSDWSPDFLEQLVDAGFAVTIFDNRDIGLSTEFDWQPATPLRAVMGSLAGRPPEAGYTLHHMAADAAALLDHLGIASAHIVGLSMGGMIAQQLTIDHPDRVRSLTSIMSNTGSRKHGRIAPRVMAKLARMPVPTRETAAALSVASFELFAGPHFDPDEHYARAQLSVDRSFRPTATARQTTAIMASPDRTAALGAVRTPTLVIHGMLDTLVLPSGGMATARAVPGSRLVMYPDMGHDLPRPRWPEMIHAISTNAARAGARTGDLPSSYQS